MATLRFKRGTSDPTASDFSNTAELLINTTDGGLFTKNDSGAVVEIGAGGGGGGGGSSTFIGLSDTPSSFTAGKWLKVNSSANALEFADEPSGGGGGGGSGPDSVIMGMIF